MGIRSPLEYRRRAVSPIGPVVVPVKMNAQGKTVGRDRLRGGGGPSDPSYSSVVSLIQGTSDIVDGKGNAITLRGDPVIGTAYDAGGAIEFDGNDDLQIAGTTKYAPGAGAFCWEAFVVNPSTKEYALLFDTSASSSAIGGMFMELSPTRGLFWGAQNGVFQSLSYTGIPSDYTVRHVMVSRTADGVLCLGVDGIIRASATGITQNIPANGYALGNYVSAGGTSQALNGSMKGARFAVGAHRYTGAVNDAYEVPTLPLPTS